MVKVPVFDVLSKVQPPLRWAELPDPVPGAGEILIKEMACGVCHTELDEIEGRLPPPHLPIVLGHQVVGRVVERLTDRCIDGRLGNKW